MYSQSLVVDDNAATVEINSFMVSKLLPGTKTKGFTNGSDLLSYLTENAHTLQQPTLIILDIDMPGLTGYEVLDHLEDEGFDMSNTDVVMSTASIFVKDREQATKFPCIKKYVQKPFRLSEMADFFSEEEVMYAA